MAVSLVTPPSPSLHHVITTENSLLTKNITHVKKEKITPLPNHLFLALIDIQEILTLQHGNALPKHAS
jgi:hypothetical protein